MLIEYVIFIFYIEKQINKKLNKIEEIEEQFNTFSYVLEDIKFNDYIQFIDRKKSYLDYLDNIKNIFKANFHFIGFIKKIIYLIILV